MTHKPRHSGGTPGVSGPPGRNYPVSKPSPAPPGEKGGGGYVAPPKPKQDIKSLMTSDKAYEVTPLKDEKDYFVKVFNNTSNYMLYDRDDFDRHRIYNGEMSRIIRDYAQSKGLPRYGNDFVEKLYNFTGAAQAASQYPTSALELAVFSAGYQLLGAGVNAYKQKETPMEALANGASDFFQNIKGIYSAEKYKDDEQFKNYEIQLIYDAFNKIDNYVVSGGQ